MYWEVTRRRLELLEEGLRKLDQSGYFGEGAARDAVLINVVSPGDSIDDPLGSAKRLNPPASLSKMLELYDVSAEPA